MQAREAMSHPVITVRTDTTVGLAARLLTGHGFTALPVTDEDGALVGIVSEIDLLRERTAPEPRAGRWGATRHSRALTVGEVMTSPVESLTPGADVADAARMMDDERIRSLPIVDGAAIVGILTRRDLLRAAVARDDQVLATEISRQLAAFAGPDRWVVEVRAGVADIADHLDRPTDRRAAVALAEGVPGVVSAEARYQTSDPF